MNAFMNTIKSILFLFCLIASLFSYASARLNQDGSTLLTNNDRSTLLTNKYGSTLLRRKNGEALVTNKHGKKVYINSDGSCGYIGERCYKNASEYFDVFIKAFIF